VKSNKRTPNKFSPKGDVVSTSFTQEKFGKAFLALGTVNTNAYTSINITDAGDFVISGKHNFVKIATYYITTIN
jgi:hypothetical protein